MKQSIWFLIIIMSASCSSPTKLDIQGHRGARGLMPENTLPAFLKAVDLGVTTLEMDLSVTGTGELIVSHEPYFSHEFCADTLGARIASDTLFNIYKMSYDDVKKFDCGSLSHPRFPDQEKFPIHKPLFVEVIDQVEEYIANNNLPNVAYNIELKTRLGFDDIYHPAPPEFSDKVYQTLDSHQIWDRITIQSFDFRTLKYFNEAYPKVNLALLIENQLPWKENIDSLGFTPDIYSCDYSLLSRENIEELKKSGMLVIPWTVNDTNDMQQLIDWGVDGLITDYPDRAIALVN